MIMRDAGCDDKTRSPRRFLSLPTMTNSTAASAFTGHRPLDSVTYHTHPRRYSTWLSVARCSNFMLRIIRCSSPLLPELEVSERISHADSFNGPAA